MGSGNIRPLFNFNPPATQEEVRAAVLQYVRKVSGFSKPSQANVATFDAAVDEMTISTQRLLQALITTAPTKDREVEAVRAKSRSARRFGDTGTV
jgi:hypothetical protein